MKRAKWEYHVLIRDLLDERATVDAFTEVRRLGEDGWELVSVNYLTAYAPSIDPPRVEQSRIQQPRVEADVIARFRKRLNGTFERMGYAPATTAPHAPAHASSVSTNGSVDVEVSPPPPRIDVLPETRLEAWFKRPV
jgi:hypothetical protein